jgi:hypothetical protein
MGAAFEELTLDSLLNMATQKRLGLWVNYSQLWASWSQLSNADRQRVLQLLTKHCGDFLLARPGGIFRLSSDEMRTAVSLRYGWNLSADPFSCSMCAGVVDVKGMHCLCSCPNLALERHGRHNGMADITAEVAKLAGHQVSMEVGMCGIGKQREADVLIHSGARDGKDQVLDIAITFGGKISDSCSRIAASDDPSQIANTYGKNVKEKKFKESVEASGQNVYIPMVTTHLGSMGTSTLAVYSRLATKVNRRKGLVNAASFTPVLFQWLSCTLQRHNHRFVSRRPSPSDLDFALEIQLAGGARGVDAA